MTNSISPSAGLSIRHSDFVIRISLLAFAILAALPLVFGLADHTMRSHSEARYALCSRLMAEDGDLLVPHALGEAVPHKPPLTYWAEAACMKVMGPTDLAARLPSVVAGVLTLAVILALGWSLHGRRCALLAGGLLATMPLFVIFSRSPLTDSLLNLFWTLALACGWMAVSQSRTRRNRWAVGMWLAVAMGMLDKGPIALLPVGILLLWLWSGGRWKDKARLWLLPGFGLSLLPMAGWVAAVAIRLPEFDGMSIWAFWWHETIGRAGSDATHPQPWWYYLPVFLGGLFPATLFLNLPVINFPLRALNARFTRSEEQGLWFWSVLVPVVGFSLLRGKMAYYLLPCCGPMALLAAGMVDGWLTGAHDHLEPGVRPPRGEPALTIASVIMTIGAAVFITLAGQVQDLPWMITVPALTVVGAWAWMSWKRRPATRLACLTVAWVLLVGMYVGLFAVQRDLMGTGSGFDALADIQAATRQARPAIATYGFKDIGLAFYLGDTPHPESPEELRDLLGLPSATQPATQTSPATMTDGQPGDKRHDWVLLAEPKAWLELGRADPSLRREYIILGTTSKGPLDQMDAMRTNLPADWGLKAPPADHHVAAVDPYYVILRRR